jgi:hypothetical protein
MVSKKKDIKARYAVTKVIIGSFSLGLQPLILCSDEYASDPSGIGPTKFVPTDFLCSGCCW